MMKKLFFFAALFMAITSQSQNSYTFSTSNEMYQNLTNSISLNNGELWDDPSYTIPIGFTFSLGGEDISTVYLNDLYTGGVLVNSLNLAGRTPLIAPVFQDIIDLGESTGTSMSNISYKTEGTSGSRILKIEWNNVGFYDDSTKSDFINFQVWLYEGTNNIEYRYGSSQINNPAGSYEEETGLGIALVPIFDVDTDEIIGEGYILSGDPTSPTLVILNGNGSDENTALDGDVPSGTVYRFESRMLDVKENKLIDFKIYPNPVSNTMKIKYNGTINSIIISNQLGQQIFNTSEIEKDLNVSQLSKGVYFIGIDTDKGFATKKFIKQ